MVVDVFNMEGQKVSSVELPPSIFDAPILVDLMHQAYLRQMANARLGTHDTKTRNEVSGGGRKPWRQKGTGRARQGSTRSPVWARGAKVHTPHPRSYEMAMPKKMRRAALRSALSAKAAEAAIVVVDQLTLPEAKTRYMASSLNKLVGDASALVLIPEKESYEAVIRSTRNLPDAKILLANYLNIRDLLVFDKIVMPLASLDVITSNLGQVGG
ncbi:MAG TPA: 50S ribosomal protein L4 [Anaerolinea thermolimosa]|uniref:Large ribosomal subunit protein uL4 n=1 Tax=Anaerolinea thermolimosa TaxID=229919 RepID=A0A3D1JGF4_9CHLR|nr:50S ribosomal protein L4 [Anaerolinea thermolimosa]GAP05778.1 50S ribosomal protein L4, bacterial [Anaerolinea thermolimosa]HCE17661.1 50S ribosomal protein L4 [Anaerolinea thermolimosa]